mmetsp:Transcript_2447/g.5329  ORF Transcript_2447/g.5329 Transcript_2447/m.5329 type:complete len:135 (-) Transcript_2447:74-478(-)
MAQPPHSLRSLQSARTATTLTSFGAALALSLGIGIALSPGLNLGTHALGLGEANLLGWCIITATSSLTSFGTASSFGLGVGEATSTGISISAANLLGRYICTAIPRRCSHLAYHVPRGASCRSAQPSRSAATSV